MLLASVEEKRYLHLALSFFFLSFSRIFQSAKKNVPLVLITFFTWFRDSCWASVKRCRHDAWTRAIFDLVTDQRDVCVTSSPHGKAKKESKTKLEGKILILDSRFCMLVRCGISTLRVSSLDSASALAQTSPLCHRYRRFLRLRPARNSN